MNLYYLPVAFLKAEKFCKPWRKLQLWNNGSFLINLPTKLQHMKYNIVFLHKIKPRSKSNYNHSFPIPIVCCDTFSEPENKFRAHWCMWVYFYFLMLLLLTFTGSRDLIPEHVDLVHPAELLEHLPQVILVHRARYLPDEHLEKAVQY